jgi:hypothetical protein
MARQARQQFFQPDRTDFGRSTTGFGQAHKGRFFKQFHEAHGVLSIQFWQAMSSCRSFDVISEN